MNVHVNRVGGVASRHAGTVIVLALLSATVVAFIVTEAQKLTFAPIAGTRITKIFSPVCGCSTDRAVISFRLRKAESLTIRLLDEEERLVRTLVVDRRYDRGPVRLVWDGRADSGRLVPDGRYRPTVHLGLEERTFVLPNFIIVDTRPPKVTLVKAEPDAISPNGDDVDDVLVVTYQLSEPAQAILYVDGREAALGRPRRAASRLAWDGRVGERRVRPGVHEIELAARDRAGNVGPMSPAQAVEVLRG